MILYLGMMEEEKPKFDYKVLQSNGKNITLLLRDCKIGMQECLKDKSVVVVITSPPYNIGIEYGNGGYNDKRPESEYLAWIERVGIEIKRVLKDNGSFLHQYWKYPKNPRKTMDVANVLRGASTWSLTFFVLSVYLL